ncbi:hypothetical protein ACFL26_00140 [Patescibacteria group bacterium]
MTTLDKMVHPTKALDEALAGDLPDRELAERAAERTRTLIEIMTGGNQRWPLWPAEEFGEEAPIIVNAAERAFGRRRPVILISRESLVRRDPWMNRTDHIELKALAMAVLTQRTQENFALMLKERFPIERHKLHETARLFDQRLCDWRRYFPTHSYDICRSTCALIRAYMTSALDGNEERVDRTEKLVEVTPHAFIIGLQTPTPTLDASRSPIRVLTR